MRNSLRTIKEYVLNPNLSGCHLRQMAEKMAENDPANSWVNPAAAQEIRKLCLDRAAKTIASFIYLVWDGPGPQEYASRTLEILLQLQDRMRGMHPDSTWVYAISAFNTDIVSRLARAANLVVAPHLKKALIRRFSNNIGHDDYLHDIARNIMELHWQRGHSLDSLTANRQKTSVLVSSRGEVALERHLQRSANEGLVAHVEQSNLTRGNIEHPTDPTIILRDRVKIQLAMGAKNAETWEVSGRQIANQIETRLGTAAGRTEARRARHTWKSAAGPTRRSRG